MKNILMFLIFLPFAGHSLVGWGGTYVIPHSLGLCENSGEYIEVGFNTNFEVNNDHFQFQRSMDPGFSWAIYVGAQINGCGTCGSRNYSTLDYGPFNPGEVWYYRVVAVSNSVNYSDHYLGSYTTPSAMSSPDWKHQVTSFVEIASTSSDPNTYNWHQESSLFQGCAINLLPTEIVDIYLQQFNSKISFDANPIGNFVDLQVNIDNTGYTTVYNGGPVTSFVWNSLGSLNSVLGTHNLKVKFTSGSATVYFREYNVRVCKSSTELHKSNNCDVLRLYSDPSNANAIPLIVSEGFDSYNTTTPEFYRFAGDALFSCLINKGFKVYVVNYKYNSQDLRNNAAIFASAIKYVSSVNSNQPIIAGGISMGGVIARYALAKAENDGSPLPVYKFVSMDSPQQGAIISKALQDFKYDKQGTTSAAGFLLHSLNNPAAKQLLINNTYENGQAGGGNYSSPNAAHTSFYSQLNSLNVDGYPHLTENIGVSFSSASNHNTVGQTWLRIDAISSAYSFGVQTFQVETEESEAGSFLPLSSTQIDPVTQPLHWAISLSASLYFFNYVDVTFTRFLNPTFIPHKSSLDIVGSVSKFDKTISTSSTGYHDVVPMDIVEPLVNALLKDNVYIQNRTFTGAYDVVAQKNIFAGNNVTNTLPAGDVFVTSTADVTFRAGQQIQIDPGFNVDPGAQFTAIIDIAHCDGSTEYQYRVGNNPGRNLTDPTEIVRGEDPEVDEKFDINLFPNPTTGILNIDTRNIIVNDIEVYNMYGEKLGIKAENNYRNIDLTGIKSGTYIVKVLHAKGVRTFSVVKME
jgi:hypothetical protein